MKRNGKNHKAICIFREKITLSVYEIWVKLFKVCSVPLVSKFLHFRSFGVGELKRPSYAIPVGTMSATTFTLVAYLVLVFFITGTCER